MPKVISLTFFLLGLYSLVRAQQAEAFIEHEKAVPFEKVYLQTDREFYFQGDTIWWAAYLLDAASHSPLLQDGNLYVELIDKDGNFRQRELFGFLQGHCPGYLSLSDQELEEGNYVLRAYTDLLKPFGEEVFFTKTIRILEVKNSAGFETADLPEPQNKSDMTFYPEGGFLLGEKVNQVAFEVLNSTGQPVSAKCVLEDDLGESVCRFETSFEGMGRFFFIPRRGRKYFARMENSEAIYELPETRTSGAKIMMGHHNSEALNVTILASEDEADEEYYIAVLHRGEGLILLTAEANEAIRVGKMYMGSGINRFVLLNSWMEPVSERLVLVDFNNELRIDPELNANSFSTREKVEMELPAPAELTADDFAWLSVAVVNENSLNVDGNAQNIKSYLLLDSELKGYIHAPARYFADDDSIKAKNKLDLLMMVHGWSNYLWNTIREKEVEILPESRLGLSISGEVRAPNEKKLLSNTEVILSVSAGSNSSLQFINTDLNGRFEFRNVIFADTGIVFVQGKNYRDRTNTSTLITGTGFDSPDPGPLSNKMLAGFTDVPVSVYRMKYLNELALNEYDPERSTRLLGEIDIVGQKKEERDDNFRIYGNADFTLELDETSYSYANLFQYLAGRVPGVQVIGEEIRVRGVATIMGSTEPLFLLDGMPIDKEFISAIPMTEIGKVEVLKSASAAIFGMRGGNGVISIFSRQGIPDQQRVSSIPGTVIQKIKGFAPYREFYSPVYTVQNVGSEAPDYRTTLYWNPQVSLSGESQKLHFFTCDNLSRYRVIVEGITNSGQICLGDAEFVVDTREK